MSHVTKRPSYFSSFMTSAFHLFSLWSHWPPPCSFSNVQIRYACSFKPSACRVCPSLGFPCTLSCFLVSLQNDVFSSVLGDMWCAALFHFSGLPSFPLLSLLDFSLSTVDIFIVSFPTQKGISSMREFMFLCSWLDIQP